MCLGATSKRYVGHRPDDYTVHYFYCYNCGKEFVTGEKDERDCGLTRDSHNVIDVTRMPLLRNINFYSLDETDKRNLIYVIITAKANNKKGNILPEFYNIANTVNQFVLQKRAKSL